MATITPNYGLSKPAGTDPVNISVLNGNADIIDTALHELNENKADQSALDELETEVNGKTTIGDVYGIGVSIPANADLDTYTAPGNYNCSSQATAQSLSNCPIAIAFRLEVKPVAGIARAMQIIYPLSSTQPYIYKRLNLSTGWSSWVVIAPLDATVKEVYGMGTTLTETVDLNDLVEPGTYYSSGTVTQSALNLPVAAGDFNFTVDVKAVTPTWLVQWFKVLRNVDDNKLYFRRRGVSSAWGTWYVFTGEAVT